RHAVARPGERVEVLVLAEAAEHVHLIGQIGGGPADRARIEHEGNRQGAQVVGRRRRAVVAGRILAAQRTVPRRAGEPVVGAGVALGAGRVADRARLDERAAAAARAVGVRDAAQVGVRPAHAGSGLAGAGARAIRVAATRRAGSIRATAATGVVDAGAARARAGLHGAAA